MRNKYLSGFIFITLFMCGALGASATDYELLQPIPVGVNGQVVRTTNFADYVVNGYKLGIGVAGVLAVVYIIWGGFDYMLTENITGKAEGRKKIENAAIGLLLALCSYAILYTINPDLVNFKGLPPLPQSSFLERNILLS